MPVNELLVILLLIAASAFFSMSEISLAASRKIKLRLMAEGGHLNAQRVLALQDSPGHFFTVVQIGLNAVAILGGVVGEQALSPYVSELLRTVYDGPMLQREMQLFPDWLLDRHLGLVLSDAERAMLAAARHILVVNALEQPTACVHRDYHSRNLMRLAHGNPGVIDFQDAVVGPISYDLVSLLRDCYIGWPAARVAAWIDAYLGQAQAAGLLAGVTRDRLHAWFDLMGAQRHLKAAGIFARLNHRDGKPGYLADIPRTLGYIVDVGERRAALRDLGRFVADRVLPCL